MIQEKVFPAHYREEDDAIQTVEEHLYGVGVKCEKYAEQLNLRNTGRLLGLLHDMGKLTDDFYNYIEESVRRQKSGEVKLNKTVDHGKHGAMLILERYHNKDIYGKIMSEVAAMLICYHHGGLEDYLSPDLSTGLLIRCGWSNDKITEDSAYKTARKRFFERVISQDALDELFQKAVEELKEYITKFNQSGGDVYYNLHLLIKFLYSCLIDADRYDTYLFMQNKTEREETVGEKSLGEEASIQVLWKEFSSRLAVGEENFRKKKTNGDMEEVIKTLRQDIWKQCNDFGYNAEGIYTLTVPTGGGKTLSSLRYALNHARNKRKKRILYVLPFTAIIEQNASVVRDILDAGDYLLEHHSNVAEDKETSKEEIEYRQLLTERWTSPIIFTTMVQFLNTFFSGGTKNIRRMHNLTDTILIFDEIQALPVKCISLFNEAINFLYNYCRDTVILCSATQPGLDKVAHKMHINQEIISDIKEKFEDFKRMEVIDARYKSKLSLPQCGDFVSDIKKDNESILIIMNTKKTAEEVYKEVKNKCGEDGINFYFLSTNLCPAHRKEIIKEMKEVLSKHRQIICVSTQLIEAGVDISFACVIRHLAGLDSIAQASGRGNRNGEGTIKSTYIIQLEEEPLGSLDDIGLGENCTINVLDDYRRDSEKFDNNLLSPKAIRHYYSYFYNDEMIEKNMDFPIKNTSIYKMLTQPQLKNEYKNRTNIVYPMNFEFQFKTAGDAFAVIDELSEAVLVSYGEGKDIIAILQSGNSKYPDYKLIRSAQPYMVNVSKKTLQQLSDKRAVYMDKNSGVWILDSGYYDDELGVVTEGKKMDILQF